MIKTTRTQFENVLLLDAGNALWSTRSPTQQTEGKLMVDAMNLMGYDAMAVGDQDLQLGPEVLQQRMAEANFPFLSANLVLASSGELLAQPYVLLEMGGRKVGIIGLTCDLIQLSVAQAGEQYTLLNAEDVLTQYVTELAELTDIIIVLSNMGYDPDEHLSSLVPGIDLIVGGRSAIPMPEGWRNGETGTIVVQAGSYGEWLGRRHLHFGSGGTVVRYSDELLTLTPDYTDDPEMRAFLDSYPAQ